MININPNILKITHILPFVFLASTYLSYILRINLFKVNRDSLRIRFEGNEITSCFKIILINLIFNNLSETLDINNGFMVNLHQTFRDVPLEMLVYFTVRISLWMDNIFFFRLELFISPIFTIGPVLFWLITSELWRLRCFSAANISSNSPCPFVNKNESISAFPLSVRSFSSEFALLPKTSLTQTFLQTS